MLVSQGFLVSPGGALRGHLRVPGDKSISHRAVILGAIAEGKTRVRGFLQGADALATVEAFRRMGVVIEEPAPGELRIHGVGLHGLRRPDGPLDMGNSGTAMRLLAGLLAGQDWVSELIGDESLSQRPMARVTGPLAEMGARIETAGGTAPLRIKPAPLRGIHYRMPVASAQVKSCLLLAGLYAGGETCVTEPAPTRDHTERMLTGFGCEVRRQPGEACLTGGARLHGCELEAPADISSAAFFLVGASIAEESDLMLEHVGINPTRTGILNILDAMGARIEILNRRDAGGEPVADLRVRSAQLKGIEIPKKQVPLAIDEFPAIAVAAACAEGETVIRGAGELRVKESDRIAAIVAGLRNLGVGVEEYADGMRIRGGAIAGGSVDSRGDHRIAMAFSMAALAAGEAVEILDCRNVATSFPGFIELAAGAGLRIQNV